ncbi:DUF2797 domain-containing protein [Arthrobacter agilis]|uniref:DUF2797 domain-containing protein n=1 Tax=Arthrobacter agilis TaxID=37921 RepID=UPI0023661ED9|nr:DUF2797 domain-containing protein [Arthrobacter agilis]WDF32717.1 DUF2797 domain-containing protein [Arthrobacter agilis]
MTSTYLSSGVTWRSSGPVLSLHAVQEDREPADAPAPDLPLTPGTRVAFEVADEGRFCLGFHRVHGRDDRTWVRCADQAPAERGSQCGRCFAQDDVRFMHDFHRSGIAPAGLKRYLDQPHWLYVATFADGSTKVGTASHPRKHARLVEQGAIVAQFVAHAADGRVVRVLEDGVTRAVGLQQAVRSGVKATALCAPLAAARLEHVNDGFALATRGLLEDGLGIDGYEVVREEFEPPASWSAVLGHAALQPYPQPLTLGRHGFTVQHVLGPSALVALDGTDLCFIADLAQLKGRRVRFGAFRTPIPAVQESLF